jgi:hypothetical protein
VVQRIWIPPINWIKASLYLAKLKMKLHLISLLLTSASVSAHPGHPHQESKREKSTAVHRRTQGSLLPVKTYQSTIDWKNNDRPFRLGDHKFNTLKEFKGSGARCASRDPPMDERIASQEKVKEYLKAYPRITGRGSTRRRLEATNIPVYFHCMTSGSTGECSSSAVDEQIAVLNAAYSPNFSFELISLQSYDRPEYYSCDVEDTDLERSMKEEFHQGGMDTLNLYSCNPAGGILGWATFPDGFLGGGSGDV